MKFNPIVEEAWRRALDGLPKSRLVNKGSEFWPQRKTYRGGYVDGDWRHSVVAQVCWDDECGNGHNTFSVTADVFIRDHHGHRVTGARRGEPDMCGCCHEEVAKAIPDLRPFIRWHLCSSDGPMHYLANVVYHAGNRDCWGRAPGDASEKRIKIRLSDGSFLKAPNSSIWQPEIEEMSFEEEGVDLARQVVAQIPGADMLLVTTKRSEGKKREFGHARSVAVWPEATDEELSIEPNELAMRLIDRLPRLMADMKEDIEGFFGFIW